MFYECPKCKKVFEGEYASCPECGAELDYTLIEKGAFEGDAKKAVPKGMSSFRYLELYKKTPLPVNKEQVKETPKFDSWLSVVPYHSSDTRESNSGLNTLFNVFWIIFVGLASVIENALTGVALCLTIIGIPAGIVCFKFIPLVFRPAGRTVVLNFKSHPVLNTLCFIFGGFANYVVYSIIGALLCVTVIGIPFGKQLFKIAKFFLAPFGSQVVLMNSYTEKRNTRHDFARFWDDLSLEDKEVKLSNGETMLASDAMCRILTDDEKDACMSVMPKTIVEIIAESLRTAVLFCAILVGVYFLTFLFTGSFDTTTLQLIIIVGSVFFVGCLLAPIIGMLIAKKNYKKIGLGLETYKKKLAPIATYYPKQAYWSKLKGQQKKEFLKNHTTKLNAFSPRVINYKERVDLYNKILNSKESRHMYLK